MVVSDTVMWRDIFLHNRNALLDTLLRFMEDAQTMARAVRWSDAAYIENSYQAPGRLTLDGALHLSLRGPKGRSNPPRMDARSVRPFAGDCFGPSGRAMTGGWGGARFHSGRAGRMRPVATRNDGCDMPSVTVF